MKVYSCNAGCLSSSAGQLKQELVRKKSEIELREFAVDTIREHIDGEGVVLKPWNGNVEIGWLLDDGKFKPCLTITLSEVFSLLMKIDNYAERSCGHIFSGGVLSIMRINKELAEGATVQLVSKPRT